MAKLIKETFKNGRKEAIYEMTKEEIAQYINISANEKLKYERKNNANNSKLQHRRRSNNGRKR